MIRSYTDLEVYQRAQKLYPEVIEFCRAFPLEARHLRDQMCRAANAIHADVAEGFGRSVAEFKMYLTRSLGSCNEVMSHITDALNAKFGVRSRVEYLLAEYNVIGKKLYRLRENWR